MIKKNPLSMHVRMDSFDPASAQDKAYMVQMRPSSTFFKDGLKRLWKNKVAVVSFFIIVILTLTCIFLPMFWPYGYDQMLGQDKFGRMDASYNNLSPFSYGATEREKMLGKANIYEVALITEEGENPAETKAKAEQILSSFLAGDKSEASFKKLGGQQKNAVKTSSYKDSPSVSDWVWEVSAFGNAKRVAGDVELIETADGFNVVYFVGYTGETESVFPHFFGTDSHGRDYLIRVVYGMRVSLAVGLFASIIVLIIGLLVGSISGYCGGMVDMIIMRIVDIIYSLPDMLMVILLASVMKETMGEILEGTVLEKIGSNIISLFIVFGLLYWVSMARLIRGQILSLREQEYVLSAQASGAKSGWIIRKHLVPNCISVIIISTALQIPSAIFTESYLSFLGLGVNAPMPSLGSLASDALNGLYTYPSRLVIPAIVISLIVLSLNLFGDGLRDAFDPKLNG